MDCPLWSNVGYTQGRSQEFDLGVYVLTIVIAISKHVNVPHVNIYHIESVLGHRRRTTTYFKGRLIWGGGYIYRYTPVATPMATENYHCSWMLMLVVGNFLPDMTEKSRQIRQISQRGHRQLRQTSERGRRLGLH